jgi:hypothetical protein
MAMTTLLAFAVRRRSGASNRCSRKTASTPSLVPQELSISRKAWPGRGHLVVIFEQKTAPLLQADASGESTDPRINDLFAQVRRPDQYSRRSRRDRFRRQQDARKQLAQRWTALHADLVFLPDGAVPSGPGKDAGTHAGLSEPGAFCHVQIVDSGACKRHFEDYLRGAGAEEIRE